MQRLTKDNFATAFQIIVIILLFSYSAAPPDNTAVINTTGKSAVIETPIVEFNTGSKKFSVPGDKLTNLQSGNLNQGQILPHYKSIPTIMLAK